jgi:hypothetical protein
MRLLGASPTKRVIRQFADEAGLVYFGYVSQRSDEHHILRGMTVSTKHHDDHYCIGTYEGYDVVLVERSDQLHSGKKHQWHIMEFDLKTTADVPHAFIGSGKHGLGFHELLATKYPHLQPATLGRTAEYPTTFTSRFAVYVTPAHAVAIEQLISPSDAATFAEHFSGLVVEITDHALYVYSEKSHLTEALLTAMLKNGAWLAARIDESSR